MFTVCINYKLQQYTVFYPGSTPDHNRSLEFKSLVALSDFLVGRPAVFYRVTDHLEEKKPFKGHIWNLWQYARI